VAESIDHAGHDPRLVAAALDRRAEAGWTTSCAACVDLFADLAGLRAALPTAVVPTRPHDYTLTAADAAHLRSSRLRRAFAAIGTARDGLTRPLAASFLGLGMVGLFIGTVPGMLPAGAAGRPSDPPIGAPERKMLVTGGVTDARIDPKGQAADATPVTVPIPERPSPLTLLSVGMLATGGGLFGLRRVAGGPGSVR
jgi:hypothetical protein